MGPAHIFFSSYTVYMNTSFLDLGLGGGGSGDAHQIFERLKLTINLLNKPGNFRGLLR